MRDRHGRGRIGPWLDRPVDPCAEDDPGARVVLGLWETRTAWEQWHQAPAFRETAEAPPGTRERHHDRRRAATINQSLAAGLIDELRLHLVAATLGAGERLFEGVGALELVPLVARGTSLVTHPTINLRRV